jgi:hypothetical protein
MLILLPPALRFDDPALLFLCTKRDNPALEVLERALELLLPFFATPPLAFLPFAPLVLALELLLPPPPRCQPRDPRRFQEVDPDRETAFFPVVLRDLLSENEAGNAASRQRLMYITHGVHLPLPLNWSPSAAALK